MERENPIAAFVQTLTLREALKPEEGGKWGVVQAKDVGYDGKLNLSSIHRVRHLEWKREREPDLLNGDDVILQSRGVSYRSGIVPEGAADLVAANGVYALRPFVDKVDPHYLVMFFNLPGTQSALRQIATGSHILNIRRDALNTLLCELAVTLPSIREQRRFAALAHEIQRAHCIETRLHELRRGQLEGLIARGVTSKTRIARGDANER